MTKEEYNRKFTIFKAFGIILVVMAHCTYYTPIYKFVHGYNVVFFLFVSGYFFNDEYLQTPVAFFKKKLKRLYKPWVIYGITYVLLHNFFIYLNILNYDFRLKKIIDTYSIQDIIYKSYQVILFYKWKEPLLTPLWFLFGLFTGLVVLYSISFIISKYKTKNFELFRLIAVLLILIAGFLGSYYYPRFNIIFRPLIIGALIYTGKLYRIYEQKIPLSLPIALLCFIFYYFSTRFSTDINVGGMRFDNHFVFIATSIAGCYWLLTLSDYLSRNSFIFSKSLEKIGQNTLSIMALHFLSFKIITLIQIHFYNYPVKFLSFYPVIPYKTAYWWIPYTIVGIIVPLFLSFLYDKIGNLVKKRIIIRQFSP